MHISRKGDVLFFMIRKDYPKFEILQGKNPVELTERLNWLMEEIACKNPEVKTDYDSSIGHYAHVRWQEEIIEPEDIRDEYKLKGIEYCCGECPFFVLQKDRRIKHYKRRNGMNTVMLIGRLTKENELRYLPTVCNKGQKTWYEHTACVELYELIKKGDVVID